ncbi:acyl carrier protein [Aureimonas fodinaquatilis]|uniref:Acyl carrier protein n=1 Tax=Aureimonas fodinaquatilis TaxID=2565783 RepID=A0A5B0E2H4_9HYPH|nr:acyl carrier protein [Aureimonas fodinaquatilis]KAA0971639.1 acyl carrier protein [Aureimonas fodinaquatilis]
MDDEQFEKLVKVIRRTFAQPQLEISRHTTAADVPGWDSLSNLFLIMEIEASFGVSLSADELAQLPDMGALGDFIGSREPQ